MPGVEDLTPDELRALADRIESAECTGLAASWCPVHGDCTCPRYEDSSFVDGNLDSPRCPLHGTDSAHGEADLSRLKRRS